MRINGFELLEVEINGELYHGLPGRGMHGYTSTRMYNQAGVPVSEHKLPYAAIRTPGVHRFYTGGNHYVVTNRGRG